MASHSRLVDQFRELYGSQVDTERSYHAGSASLREAIDRAAYALTPGGGRHPHQARRTRQSLDQACGELQAIRSDIAGATRFGTLHDLAVGATDPVHGIGPLTQYDIAWRIGAFLSLEPDVVYLHSGTRDGAVALGYPRWRSFLRVCELPEPVQSLTASEIEDYLCIFKDEFVSEPRRRRRAPNRCSEGPVTGCQRRSGGR